MKICKYCIQPDSRPGIFFQNDVCGACIWEKEKDSINWQKRLDELQNIGEWAKKNSDSYDCVIGVSGGKDSTVQAITARDRLGLNCLLVNCEPAQITDIGKYNMENLKNLGFDVITIKPNIKTLKKLMKRDFYKYLNPIKITEFALWSSTYIIAEKFGIPLIIQGENPGLTLGTRLTGVGTDSNALKANELQTLSTGWEEYLDEADIFEKDLFFFHYNRTKLEKNNVKGIWLQYYLKEWSQRGNAEFAKKYGMKWNEQIVPSEIGTYMPFMALDSDFNQVNQMLKFIKFGFGQCMDAVCYDLREKRISREEAIELVKKYDGKCSKKYIQKLCDFIGITIDEFFYVTENFRGTMWNKNNGEWENSFWKILK